MRIIMFAYDDAEVLPVRKRRRPPTIRARMTAMLGTRVTIEAISALLGVEKDSPLVASVSGMIEAVCPLDRATWHDVLSAISIVQSLSDGMARERLFDRVDGRPVQHLAVSTEESESVREMSDMELLRITEGRENLLGDGATGGGGGALETA